MDWLKEVQEKLKKKNQILFSQESDFLKDLAVQMDQQNHRTLVLLAFDLAEEAVKTLEMDCLDCHPARTALEISKLWAFGKTKMAIARKAILNCHALAKEIPSPEKIALCHAVGQACSVVHTVRHSMGFPIYDLTALVRKYGLEHCRDAVEKRKQEYMEKLLYWSEHYEQHSEGWADFMLK